MDLGLDLWRMKELALLMDQLGVRPETDVSTGESLLGHPPALGLCMPHGEACSVAQGRLSVPSLGCTSRAHLVPLAMEL